MNIHEAQRLADELMRGTGTIVSVDGLGGVSLDGRATASQLRGLADLANAIDGSAEIAWGGGGVVEVHETVPTVPGIERTLWGGPGHSTDIPSALLGDRGPTLYISIRDELTRMGFGIPEEGSKELFTLERQLRELMPAFEGILEEFVGMVNNSATETLVRHQFTGFILNAIETGKLTLKRTWGKKT